MNRPVLAPLDQILSVLIPLVLESGVQGYLGAPVIARGERKLTEYEIRPVLAGASYLCAWNYAVDKEFDYGHVLDVFDRSLGDIAELSPTEQDRVCTLVRKFTNYEIIREEHPFDDWICESWWDDYQSAPYDYPSQMSNAIAHGLDQKKILESCTLVDAR